MNGLALMLNHFRRESEWCMELNLTFDCKVVQRVQFIYCGTQMFYWTNGQQISSWERPIVVTSERLLYIPGISSFP